MTRIARILLAPYLVFVLLLTWLPAEDAGQVTGIVATVAHLLEPAVPFAVGYPVLEFLANVAMFAPLGVLTALAWPRISAGWIVGAGAILSAVIELVQLAMPTRYSTISDVIANTLGMASGWVLVALWQRRSGARRTVGE
ncbi:VanZ family protein [Microbacterium sp. KUDC0406]|uniref:VanZ family protein n=1 Tax=Microbacterium sp. KUDC0406 TaxID=2909588 RepID=UPI001F26A801|nr:VanZ family protein [Microbacterium sp. KUDC0406]UJP08899.1 VanZ family protein [Microbacterium sp. KUDC0406]